MPRMSFRDRFLTPPVARAMFSPSGILLAGAGAGLAIATGLPLLVAPVAGVAAWAARVLAAVPRQRPAERIDPFTVPEPWRRFVVEALKAQVRYRQAISGAQAGAIRERLESIGARIDDGVEEAWRIARRGAQLEEARATIDDAEIRRELGAVTRAGSGAAEPGSAAERTAVALRSQLEAAARLDATIDDARSQLRLLDARLDESVARATELSVRVGDVDELGPVGADVEGLVQEMEALRLALEDVTQGTDEQAAGG
ncbi:MAG TPA: hypothetical protein VFV42_05895 [Acidimicrobiales bacterium]|nr:hypothetical protein [Acidimicrobiales bacterium]